MLVCELCEHGDTEYSCGYGGDQEWTTDEDGDDDEMISCGGFSRSWAGDAILRAADLRGVMLDGVEYVKRDDMLYELGRMTEKQMAAYKKPLTPE